jgi:MgsA AAA+ ATPase C terminal
MLVDTFRDEMSPSYLSSSLRIICFEFRNLIGFSSLKANVNRAFHSTESLMYDALSQAKHRLTVGLDREPPVFEPLIADKWVVNSLLQKSIRRGEVEVAQRAALTFLGQRGSAIWRRFMIIAFEDVGAASPDAVAMTVAASTDARWRKQSGGDIVVAAHLARLLVEAPKSRAAEHLITSSNDHPSLEQERRAVSSSSIAENLAAVADKSNSLTHRALAGWCVSGIGWEREKVPGSNLPALLDTFRQLGVPDDLVAVTGTAATKSGEPITLMVPLIWLAASDDQAPIVVASAVPGTAVFDGIPMYALDKHTRIGQEAIRSLVKYNSAIREFLERHVAPAQRHAAAYMAAFHADAAPLASKLAWDGADQLEALGTEADLLKVGVPAEQIEPLLQLFRANISHLNKLRAHTICKKQGLVDVASVLMADEKD